MAMSCYTKLFVSDIGTSLKGTSVSSDVTKIVMKSSVLGIITAIKKFSRRTIYTVDDGTGSLDCVLWNDESVAAKKINKLKMDLDSQEALFNHETISTCHLLLNKVEANEMESEYNHGDKICCLGIVKMVKGKLLLDINHHYQVHNVNAETLWNLEVLASHK